MTKQEDKLKVALAQMAPIWLDKQATLAKVLEQIDQAAAQAAELVVFGEALVPGYPFWVELTEGAVFESEQQKQMHDLYLQQAINIEQGDLDEVCQLAKEKAIAVYLGTIERASDRGGHSLYCSMVYISEQGKIGSVHRKLMPTYEERLTWSIGDGHGLRVHPLKSFTLGGLNCWENWMPLPRAALYGLGEDLHVAIWPGNIRNTQEITRFIAKESRSYVLSVSGMLSKSQIPSSVPLYDQIIRALEANDSDVLADGGSCICAPDGEWLIEPTAGEECLLVAELDHALVRKERHNFDPAGHYSRPDVTKLTVNRTRQSTIEVQD
jgi:nitrilase